MYRFDGLPIAWIGLAFFLTGTAASAQPCLVDPDCDDGDPCTFDVCNNGSCEFPPEFPCCGNGVVEPGEFCDPPDGITCDENCFPPPPSACCLPDNTCSVLPPIACQSSGGLTHAEFPTCAGVDCAAGGQGACCLPDGTCVLLTEVECALVAGAYQGDGTDCISAPCPDPHLDVWRTCGDTRLDLPPFGPGCGFFGQVDLVGIPPQGDPNYPFVDTILRRLGDPVTPIDPPGAAGSVQVQLVGLNLQSVAPVPAICNGEEQHWTVIVQPSPSAPAPEGSLSAFKTHDNGGTFDALLPLQPEYTFTRIHPNGDCNGDGIVDLDDLPFLLACLGGPNQPSAPNCPCADLDGDGYVDLADLAAFLNLFNTPVGPPDVVVIDTGLLGEPPIPFEVAGAPFVHAVNPGLDTLPAPGTDFHPGIREQIPGVIDSQEIDPVIQVATEGQQTVCVPQPLRCIYQVTCIESDCDGCSMQMLDLCLGSACDNDTCPTSFRRTCGESECCLEYTLVECRVPQGEPTCPEGDFCTCLPVR